MKQALGVTVFDAAVQRLTEQYAQGHRIVVSVSGGKDSTVCMELAIIAASITNRLPVDVVTRDEEIMFPGTYEYLERVAARPEVRFRWMIANQPCINAFDRHQPYWWVFDPLLHPDDWVRKPPGFAERIPDQNIQALVSRKYFPTEDGQELHAVLGLRIDESPSRALGLYASGGYLTKPNRLKVRFLRPIYDWIDGDVWLAIRKYGWDYNDAYDVMNRLKVPRRRLRISPPTMNAMAGDALRTVGSVAWPEWWNRVCRRLPSIRTFARYGTRAVLVEPRTGESWEECYQRTCIDTAPGWIAERATKERVLALDRHRKHSPSPLPQTKVARCKLCPILGSWQCLTDAMYNGDPFSFKDHQLPYVEPDYFRPGAGTWGGRPCF